MLRIRFERRLTFFEAFYVCLTKNTRDLFEHLWILRIYLRSTRRYFVLNTWNLTYRLYNLRHGLAEVVVWQFRSTYTVNEPMKHKAADVYTWNVFIEHSPSVRRARNKFLIDMIWGCKHRGLHTRITYVKRWTCAKFLLVMSCFCTLWQRNRHWRGQTRLKRWVFCVCVCVCAGSHKMEA